MENNFLFFREKMKSAGKMWYLIFGGKWSRPPVRYNLVFFVIFLKIALTDKIT